VLHQLARFSAIAPLVEELGHGEVLDVGSGNEGIAGWLSPGWSVTGLDRSFEVPGAMRAPRQAETRQIVGDAAALPFPDRSFDVVLAIDVLEHIDPKQRPTALGEMVRVASQRVIVACPTGRAAHAADDRLAERLRRRGMEVPPWLAEHGQSAFPEREDLSRELGQQGSLRLIGHENIRWHEWLFTLESRRPGHHASRVAAQALATASGAGGAVAAISRVATRVARGPDRPPSYRTIAVLDLPTRATPRAVAPS
jgi:ubiquinone/menaquinone biosynthesis C-methylase UbiE